MQSSLGISSRRNNNNDMKLNDSKCFYPTISGNEIRVCLFVYSGPGPSPVMGCPYSGILSQAQGVGVFVTPLLPKKVL